ncbi:MAG: putative sugar O-methyltransferase [Candidatus Omnitrophota bacterium]
MSVKNAVRKVLNSALFRSLGISLINYDFLKYLKHYLWVFHSRSIPALAITFNEPGPVTSVDLLLSRRLIAAYKKASADRALGEKSTSRLWSQELKRNCGALIAAVEAGNERELSRLLSSMFTSDFVYGLASGSLVEHSKGPLGRKIWSMKYQDNIVALAEYLGVVRAESTQQGAKGYALKDGLGAVVGMIEQKLGMPVGFPDIGAPYGVKAGKSLITMEHPEHLYVALRLGDAAGDHCAGISHPLRIVEIGAGFGGLAYWIISLKRLNVGNYTIVDLPLINIIQGYFLAKAFGPERVSLFGERSGQDILVTVLPNVAYETEIKGNFDILVNENSMPEMSDEIVSKYIRFARDRLTGVFFSYNHEAYSVVYGKPQVFVPGIVESVGGFQRLSRNASWLRSGYVEEVYRVQNQRGRK